MIYSISNDKISVCVNSHGSELWSIRDSNGLEYLWQGNVKYWGDRAPVLFPFVGRLPDESYMMDGSTYFLPIHGFAYSMEHSLVSKASDRLVLELRDTPKSYEQYPRHFLFKTEYRLSGSRLYISYSVENHDERMMYFGLGGHPGFNVPLTSQSCFEDWYLEFAEERKPLRVGFSPRLLINGEETDYPLIDGRRIPLSHELFDDDAIILKNAGTAVSLRNEKDGHSVTVSFPQMQYIGFWHRPKTDAPYICIEPWCSIPGNDAGPTVLENRNDLIALPAGGKYENIWSIEIN